MVAGEAAPAKREAPALAGASYFAVWTRGWPGYFLVP